jgi:hypothetical protein
VPLPFFFLFPLPFFFLVVSFFPCFGLPDLGVFVARRLWQVICAFPPHLSPIATFLSGALGQILSEPLRLIVWRFISLFLLCFLLFLFLFVLPGFWFWFFPVLFFLCLFCVFYFCNFSDLLRVCFTALHLLPGFISHPPRQTSNALVSGRGLLERNRFFPVFSFFLYLFFPCISVVFLLIIILSPRWFDWIPFGPDLCVVDMYVILAFGSKRKIDPDFYVVDECVS